VDQARITWWYNFRESGGMRLTKHGYDAFVKELEIESNGELLDSDEIKDPMYLHNLL
jgi:hypothetical protein